MLCTIACSCPKCAIRVYETGRVSEVVLTSNRTVQPNPQEEVDCRDLEAGCFRGWQSHGKEEELETCMYEERK